MLKELYIDSFNFISQNSNCEVESFICDHFNNEVIGIRFERDDMIDFVYIFYGNEGNSVYASYYKRKGFHMGSHLVDEYKKLTELSKKLFICKLKHHLGLNIESIR